MTYDDYKEWVHQLLRDYYNPNIISLRPIMVPSYDEWILDTQIAARQKKINEIIK